MCNIYVWIWITIRRHIYFLRRTGDWILKLKKIEKIGPTDTAFYSRKKVVGEAQWMNNVNHG
jgi:hypothetical protein